MDPVSSHVVLPLELEWQIFEICACSRPVTIPKLMLVARRVKEWVEPLLYRTIVISVIYSIDGHPDFTEDILWTVLRSKPAAFFRDSVRHVLIHGTWDDDADWTDFVRFVLSICTGVQTLFVSQSHPLLELSTMPFGLKHLCTTFMPLLIDIPSTSPLFAQLTHLELIGPASTDENTDISTTVALLPRLTHLSFNEESEEAAVPFIPSYLTVLQNCASLSVLISLWDHDYPEDLLSQYVHALAKDPRFVVLDGTEWFRDWEMEVLDGSGYWSQAENFIAKRRSGEIDAREYRMSRQYP
ncbi:hypothetical protein MVEN_00580100 [Mycena venus]|uniref:F-box domain-containing protein n=1 Tax=Mycena venus TaxID=2733690 RepID=A0A8H7D5N5_9AGAR|nr:hypothetical protein MVEN_00580100 [Mycena venus]